eukprot:scaffold11297_cov41-Cyclotella_meneghiniana.AAC.2
MFQIPWLSSFMLFITLVVLTGSPTDMNFYKIALLHTTITHVWLLTLQYLQATVGRQVTSSRPPPKPDPVPSPGLLRLQQKNHNLMWHDMSSKAAMLYVPVFSLISFEWSFHSHASIQFMDMVTHDDLSSLSNDIDELLREPPKEWSMDATLDSTLAASLTTPSPKPRPIYFVKRSWFSGRHIQWLCTLLAGLFHIQSAHGFDFQDIVLEATEGVPQFSTGSPTVSFSPSHPGWRTRRRFKKWSHETNSSLPDSQQFWVPKHESCEGDAACKPSEPTSAFLSSFNPASSGMELIVAERLDRLMHHVSVPTKNTKHTVGSSRLPMSPFSTPLVLDWMHHLLWILVPPVVLLPTVKISLPKASVLDSYGAEYTIKLKAYHMPGASVRLLSPQSLYTSIKGSDGHQDATKYTMYIPSVDGHITLEVGSYLWTSKPSPPSNELTYRHQMPVVAHIFFSCGNQNLTAAQKEVLLWHFKLSHAGISSIHNLCRQKRTAKVDTVDES